MTNTVKPRYCVCVCVCWGFLKLLCFKINIARNLNLMNLTFIRGKKTLNNLDLLIIGDLNLLWCQISIHNNTNFPKHILYWFHCTLTKLTPFST